MEREQTLRTLLEGVRNAVESEDRETALDALEMGTESLRIAFQDDPGMAVTGELFEAADQLTAVALELAGHFSQAELPRLEERAWRVRYESVVTAHTYRRNLVGPALLDWADCQKRLGRIEEADALYDNVIRDFSRLLGWGPTFDPDWLVAVQCLERAMSHSTRDFSVLQGRTRLVLQQSEELRAAQKA
jgi:hypothetical protein